MRNLRAAERRDVARQQRGFPRVARATEGSGVSQHGGRSEDGCLDRQRLAADLLRRADRGPYQQTGQQYGDFNYTVATKNFVVHRNLRIFSYFSFGLHMTSPMDPSMDRSAPDGTWKASFSRRKQPHEYRSASNRRPTRTDSAS